jgi:precorrin-2 dehydrogenase/sirohydrochlorin ferrochelatase
LGENNRKNIFNEGIDYSYIALISEKLRIGIVGGGKAGTIKAKHFIKNKCYVEILSDTFNDEIIEISKRQSEKLKLINAEFGYEFLRDKHIIIIALDDEIIKNKIKKYCDENYKLYIDSSCFIDGMGSVPVQESTENITFALNTRYGNPKGAKLLSNKIKTIMKDYDKFIKFTGKIRSKAKALPEYKNEIIEFINNDNFKKCFDEGNSENVLRAKFPKEIVDNLIEY